MTWPADVPWTQVSGAAVGAHWLAFELGPSASPLAHNARDRERCFRPGDEAAVRAALERVGRIATEVDVERLEAIHFAIKDGPDVRAALLTASEGGVLSDVELFEIARLLDAVSAVTDLATAAAFADLVPVVDSHLRAALEPGRVAPSAFYVADAFDPTLEPARAQVSAARAAYDSARSRSIERVASIPGLEAARDGEFVVMRDRLDGALPSELHVLRETPAYLLCDVSLDDAALTALAARDAAAERVAALEEAVRMRLSRAVAASAAGLRRACDMLGDLDLLVWRARFARRNHCAVPEIVDGTAVAFEDARYLPLEDELSQRGLPYSPISLELDGIGVVTGPNMGGKSAALRTLGFLAACVALGVPVPAKSARLPLFDEIVWFGIGAAAADDRLLSSFGAEVVGLQAFLERRSERSLVLADELARTTSPREGRALLVALLEALRDRGAVALAATHLADVTPSGVAHFATGGLTRLPPRQAVPLDLDWALRRIADAMDFRLRRVSEDTAPPADAIALADALGLDPRLIERAKEVL